MPVDAGYRESRPLVQREQFAQGGIGRWYWDFRDESVLRFIEGESLRILDLGCGEGITLERLLRHFPGCDIQGIDVMPENIEICESHGLPARLGNLYSLDMADESQDVVLLLEVIEHLDDPERALKEIFRILTPGGKLIVLFPHDKMFLLSRLLTLKFREAFYDPGHLRQWTPGHMTQVLSGIGFKVIANRNIPFYFWLISLHGLVVVIKPAGSI